MRIVPGPFVKPGGVALWRSPFPNNSRPFQFGFGAGLENPLQQVIPVHERNILAASVAKMNVIMSDCGAKRRVPPNQWHEESEAADKYVAREYH